MADASISTHGALFSNPITQNDLVAVSIAISACCACVACMISAEAVWMVDGLMENIMIGPDWSFCERFFLLLCIGWILHTTLAEQ